MAHLLTPKLLKMGESIFFHCPGCDMLHPYRIEGDVTKGPVWGYNGNADNPTFTPSLLVDANRPERRCHLFITDGRIQYLGDCFHALKNTTIDLVDIPEPEIWVD